MEIYAFCWEVRAYGGGLLQANIISPYPRELFTRWNDEGLQGPPDSPLIFHVRPKAKHPDIYFTGLHTPLQGDRAVRLYEDFDVNLEKYPVQMVDASGNSLYERLSYYMCRLRDKIELTTLVTDPGFLYPVDFVVEQHTVRSIPPLFVDPKVGYPLIRPDLKQAMEDVKLTGCDFVTLLDLATRMRSPVIN